MNIQEAYTKAKNGKVIARGAEAIYPNDAILYVPEFAIGSDTAENIGAGLNLTYFRVKAGFFKIKVDPDTGYHLDPFQPSEADILATDWIEFNL